METERGELEGTERKIEREKKGNKEGREGARYRERDNHNE